MSKLRSLTRPEIETLASREGVRRIAVENFLSTLYLPAGYFGSLGNLERDAWLYHWNAATVKAIRDGIELAAGD